MKDLMIIDLSKYFHNVTETLNNYRALSAFCECAIEQITWNINGVLIPTRLMCNAESALTTADIKAQIDMSLERYEAECVLRKEDRKFNIIRFKYIQEPGKGKENKPYTNEDLSDYFDCSMKTIERDVRQAKSELKIYFFGVDRINRT